ncbi:hypothetical protein JDV02_001900 [Purpureocillium takamizusanense]|uniref:Uncharacterized protein n=1 Tax=Purpureocillium takamizusanense TaxID=2060973 RepID=A0A9Q8V758_9HYPO|nr:uncharacterized protein JDV02_001900 [Purpureocillium takamizusanense]UNI15363.1 hypothetical protein JDV02_001900 [Purpureocillium takamizusanense]
MHATVMRRTQPDSVEAAVDRLREESRTIQNRGGLTSRQVERVDDAFALLASGEPPPGSTGAANRSKYLKVLKRVEEINGLAYVVLCAAGLGRSTIACMKESMRVGLPIEMKKQKDDLDQPALEKIASTYTTKQHSEVSSFGHNALSMAGEALEPDYGLALTTTSQYTGDAYELTWDDARMIAKSGQDVGKVYLIDTYAETAHSFVIMPVSLEMTNHFAMRRARV